MIKTRSTPGWGSSPTWLHFLLVLLLVLGVFFRLFNIDKKNYWADETYTSLRISGYLQEEVYQQVYDGHVIGAEDLQKYQRLNSEKGVIDTIKGLAIEEPQHPPLYYVMSRFWVQWFGNSVAVTRSLAALISLLVFPCSYWLCLELFKSPLVGWVAIALIAVSPFHVAYAQEAREYSLWTVTILLSSAALLRAIRLKTKFSWGIYAATIALALYTYLFSVFIAIGHGIYLVVTEKFRLSKAINAYLLASFIGFLAFAPWCLVLITQLSSVQTSTDWITQISPLSYLTSQWVANLGSLYIYWGANPFTYTLILRSLILPILMVIGYAIYFLCRKTPKRVWLFILTSIGVTALALMLPNLVFGGIRPTIRSLISGYYFGIQLAIAYLPLILMGYSIYFLCRKTPKRVWLFILTLIGVTALALMLPDLIFGGIRSTLSRYLIPCYLGIQLAVAYLLATQITSISVNIKRQKLWQLIMLALVSGGLLSCAISSQAEYGLSTFSMNHHNQQMARIINQASQPLLISDDIFPGRVLSLSYHLEPKVRLQLVLNPNILKIPDSFSDIFVYYPSKPLLYKLEKEQKYKIEPIYKPDNFWLGKLAKR